MRRYIFYFIVCSIAGAMEEDWHWSWACNVRSGRCEKQQQQLRPAYATIPSSNFQDSSLAVCRLICGKYGALWPKPTGTVTLTNELVPFHPSSVKYDFLEATEEVRDFLEEIVIICRENMALECGKNCTADATNNVLVSISVNSKITALGPDTDESYSLEVNTKVPKVLVQISSETVFGARHALETLTQLMAADQQGLVMVANVKIKDKPVYRHRGLLLDTARNYLPIRTIKKQITAMAASKMNVLHWHATDSQSFPIESSRIPQLSRYGAYSPNQVYTMSDIRDLVKYAKIRGVRVLMEIDAPSHSGNGWQWGPSASLGDLAVCVNKAPWRKYCIQPPCGQLNPVNPNVYQVLGQLYLDLLEVLPTGEYFHMGGDEVFLPCWNSSAEIISYLASQGRGTSKEDFLSLWSEFQEKSLNQYDRHSATNNTPIVLWSSQLTEPDIIEKYLPKDRYIIETWVPASSDLPMTLLQKGYRLIISTKDAWYLDHGFWGTTQYHTWRIAYKNRLPRHEAVLGGEVCMWGELVDEASVESRVWPRAAAAAERLWSDPEGGPETAEARLYRHRERLITRKIQAEALAPRWCLQNEGDCL